MAHACTTGVQLWLLQVHACACTWMRTVCRTGRMSLSARTCVRLVVDRLEGSCSSCAHPTQRMVRDQFVCLVYDVWARRLASVQCMLKLRRSARPKTNCTYTCAWARRSIYSRLSPPAGPAPALYNCGRPHKEAGFSNPVPSVIQQEKAAANGVPDIKSQIPFIPRTTQDRWAVIPSCKPSKKSCTWRNFCVPVSEPFASCDTPASCHKLLVVDLFF